MNPFILVGVIIIIIIIIMYTVPFLGRSSPWSVGGGGSPACRALPFAGRKSAPGRACTGPKEGWGGGSKRVGVRVREDTG